MRTFIFVTLITSWLFAAKSPSQSPLEDWDQSRAASEFAPSALPQAKNKDTVVTYPKAQGVPLIFDIPVSYNGKVQAWIQFFQTSGRVWYTKWLERSTRYLPVLQKILREQGLPQDLAYMAMIESGFSAHANSIAQAVGPWQFIHETGVRYGLKVSWWIDERRDFQKSTLAASKYLKDLHRMFSNWYLVAASFNTGENRVRRIVKKRGTTNFWILTRYNDFQKETRDYVPKLIAAMLIAKAPQMYGFRNINYAPPLSFEHFWVPGGTKLQELADAIGVTKEHLVELNPELIRAQVPSHISGHRIRIPKGSQQLVSHYFRKTLISGL